MKLSNQTKKTTICTLTALSLLSGQLLSNQIISARTMSTRTYPYSILETSNTSSLLPSIDNSFVTSSLTDIGFVGSEQEITLTLAQEGTASYSVDGGPEKSFTNSTTFIIGEGKCPNKSILITVKDSSGVIKKTFTYFKAYSEASFIDYKIKLGLLPESARPMLPAGGNASTGFGAEKCSPQYSNQMIEFFFWHTTAPSPIWSPSYTIAIDGKEVVHETVPHEINCNYTLAFNGSYKWTPSLEDAGTHTFTFTVYDGTTVLDTRTISYTIATAPSLIVVPTTATPAATTAVPVTMTPEVTSVTTATPTANVTATTLPTPTIPATILPTTPAPVTTAPVLTTTTPVSTATVANTTVPTATVLAPTITPATTVMPTAAPVIETNTPAPTTTITPTVAPTKKPVFKFKSFTCSKKKPQKVGQKIKLSASTINADGKVKYKFCVQHKKSTVVIKKYSTARSAIWKPKKAGTYNLIAYAKSSNKVIKKVIRNYKIVK